MTTRLMPPFEIYSEGVHIGDINGHVCTAESRGIALLILAALRDAYPPRNAEDAIKKETTDNA